MRTLIAPWFILFGLLAAPLAAAEGRVEIVLTTDRDFPALEVQEWHQLFKQLGVSSLQIRQATASDKVQLKTSGSEKAPIYRVTGALTARGDLLVPGHRFKLKDAAGISSWLSSLKKYGPAGPPTRPKLFGMEDEDIERIQADLKTKVDFTTQGKRRADVVREIAEDLNYELTLDRQAIELLDEAGTLDEELQGFSAGAALAYVVRPAGLGLAPSASGGELSYAMKAGARESQVWPVGLSVESQRQKLLPNLFEFVDVEIAKGTPLSTALVALSEQLQVPLLLDYNGLAAADIDPAKTPVELPPKRLAVSQVLSRVLGPHLLTSELRIDDGGKTFLWITPVKRP